MWNINTPRKEPVVIPVGGLWGDHRMWVAVQEGKKGEGFWRMGSSVILPAIGCQILIKLDEVGRKGTVNVAYKAGDSGGWNWQDEVELVHEFIPYTNPLEWKEKFNTIVFYKGDFFRKLKSWVMTEAEGPRRKLLPLSTVTKVQVCNYVEEHGH